MVSTAVPRQLSATAFAMLFSPIQGALTAALSLLMGQAVRISDTTSVDSSHRSRSRAGVVSVFVSVQVVRGRS
jgi:hypothetical protein